MSVTKVDGTGKRILVTQTGRGAARSQLNWFDRNGKLAGAVGTPARFELASNEYSGITIIVTQEHIAFLETLAERVAMSVLAHPRAVSVMVRVEKLDLGSGGVGVEIVRERPADVAKIHHLYPAAAGQT